MESSVISGDLKQMNDKMDILESKTEIIGRELKKELDTLSLIGMKRIRMLFEI